MGGETLVVDPRVLGLVRVGAEIEAKPLPRPIHGVQIRDVGKDLEGGENFCRYHSTTAIARNFFYGIIVIIV